MPTYHYQCRNCGHELEEFQSMTEPVLTRCPSCQTDGLMRSIGAGAGLIFKGTGFYLTDYKKGGKTEGAKSTAGGSGAPEKKAKDPGSKGDSSSGSSTAGTPPPAKPEA